MANKYEIEGIKHYPSVTVVILKLSAKKHKDEPFETLHYVHRDYYRNIEGIAMGLRTSEPTFNIYNYQQLAREIGREINDYIKSRNQ